MKKIKIKNNNLYILDEELKKKINQTKLSPSMLGSWLKSPADWILEKFITPDVQIKEAIHLTRGTWFHSIMEHFFKLPEKERTLENLKKTTREVTKENYPTMLNDNENKEWLKNAISNYSKMWLDNAKNEKVAQIFIMGKSQQGLELFVNGKIGEASRPCLGFIDRLIEGEYGLLVQDWKTGKTISDYNPNLPISENNSFDYWRQQTFYALLLENLGILVEGASLIFPCSEPPAIINVDFMDDKVREQVIKDVEQVDSELTECINNGYCFPFKKGKYNSWASWLCGLGNAKKPEIFEDKFFEIAEIE